MNLNNLLKGILCTTIVSCGASPETINTRNYDSVSEYKRVDGATITISKKEGKLSLTTNFDINYTSVEANVFDLDATGMVVTESEDGDTLDLGNLLINGLRKNKLKICGIGNDEKCNSAIIRIYTNDNYSGTAGIVNTTYDYSGGDLLATGTGGQSVAGLTDSNALTLAEYIIPANDRKLTKSDFIGAGQLMDYALQIDFSNAGDGDYEISIEIELAVAL